MSGLIKADADLGPFGVRALAFPVTMEDVPSPAARRIHALETELEESQRALADSESARDEERRRAFDEGFAAGTTSADDGAEERLAVLAESAGQGRDDLRSALESMERLAALVARDCLDRMFEDADDRAALVDALVRKQIQAIEASAILTVFVAAGDFDEATLTRLRAQFVRTDTAVVALDELSPGACRMQLALGQVEVGIDQQWGTLGNLLGEFARPDAGR